MAEKISVEIDLEGGAEVEKQLEDIGKAGQQAFKQIGEAADQVDFSSISADFQQVGDTGVQAFEKIQTAVQSAAVFEQIVQGIQKVEGAFESLGAAITKMATRMTRSLGALGVLARALGPVGIALGLAGGAFVKFSNQAEKALSDLTAEAAKLDLTAQQLDKLEKALGQLGISSDAIIPGLQKAKETLGGLGGGLARLGDVSQVDDFAGRLRQFIAQLETMPDSVQRTQLAMRTLGDALGAQVIAGLQTGAISAKNFAAALGAIKPLTPEQLVDAAKYEQAINRMSAAWTQFKAEVASPLLTPIFGFITSEVQKLSAGLEGIKNTYQTVKAMLSQDFDLPWLAKLVNFDPNLLLSKWQPVFQGLQGLLGMAGVQFDWLDQLVAKSQAASQALAQTGQAGAQAGSTAAQGANQGQIAFTAWGEAIRLVNGQSAQTAQAVGQVGTAGGQAGQQAAQGFTSVEAILARIQAAAGQAGAAVNEVKPLEPPDASIWTSWAETIISAIQGVINKLLEWIGLKERSGGAPAAGGGGGNGGNGEGGLAGGGLIGGRGTGTSDSNLAWVSRGEHIMPARAVAQPGVLAFLELLRRSGGNLRGVLDGMGRFALDGLVPRAVPAFAGGGPVGGMSHVTIQFPGLPPIAGLRASSDVIGELQRAAAMAQVRSGGRKPSRYS